MFGIDLLLLGAIVTLPISLVSFAVYRAARSARLNHDERCGTCGGPLYASRAWAGPSLLEGHLICEPCAAKQRRGLRRSVVLAVAITGAAILALAGVALWDPSELGSHPWIPVIATVVTYPALFGGAVAWMKKANRRAALRLGVPSDLSLPAPNDAAPGLTRDGIAASRSRRTDA